MNSLLQYSGNYFDKHFNAKSVRSVELLILRVAVFAFLFHLIIIFLGNNFIYFKNLFFYIFYIIIRVINIK